MNYEKIVLVTRKTRLEGLVERFNTREQARFYLEHSGDDFSRYEEEHIAYQAALRLLRERLGGLARLQVIERAFLPNFLFSPADLVVTLGVDGLVVNTAKYLDGQPLIAVNPDPTRIDGVLLPFSVAEAERIARKALLEPLRTRAISMAEARLADGQRLLAFNDLFIGARSHVSARYRLEWAGREERHSSSGVIVSTGAGATGWLSSLFNMANGMQAAFAGSGVPVVPLCDERLIPPRNERLIPPRNERLIPPRLEWEDERLAFVVREPFASKVSSAGIVCGLFTAQTPLVLRSEMPEGGVIFSDGVENDFLAFNAGAVATIGLARKKTHLVVGSST